MEMALSKYKLISLHSLNGLDSLCLSYGFRMKSANRRPTDEMRCQLMYARCVCFQGFKASEIVIVWIWFKLKAKINIKINDERMVINKIQQQQHHHQHPHIWIWHHRFSISIADTKRYKIFHFMTAFTWSNSFVNFGF